MFFHLKIPPPIQTLLIALLMLALDSVYPVSLMALSQLWYVILPLIAGSIVFILPAIYKFWKDKTTVNPINLDKSTKLIVAGVYQYSRNPMYVGMAGFLAAWMVYLSNPYALILFVLYVVVMTEFQIKPEEQALTKLFGDDYIEYTQQVRRWL
jgi:protein-S-isoprenylcysteine O-methyltransferase Ste14